MPGAIAGLGPCGSGSQANRHVTIVELDLQRAGLLPDPFYAGDQQLYLMTWEVGGQTFGNHSLAGFPPISLEHCRAWLPAIAALPRPFDAGR